MPSDVTKWQRPLSGFRPARRGRVRSLGESSSPEVAAWSPFTTTSSLMAARVALGDEAAETAGLAPAEVGGASEGLVRLRDSLGCCSGSPSSDGFRFRSDREPSIGSPSTMSLANTECESGLMVPRPPGRSSLVSFGADERLLELDFSPFWVASASSPLVTHVLHRQCWASRCHCQFLFVSCLSRLLHTIVRPKRVSVSCTLPMSCRNVTLISLGST